MRTEIIIPVLAQTLPAADSVVNPFLQYGVLGIVCVYLIIDRTVERKRHDEKEAAAIARQDAREKQHLQRLDAVADSINALAQSQLLSLVANKHLEREFQEQAEALLNSTRTTKPRD